MTISRAAAKAKGASGELEILGILGNIVHDEFRRRGWPIPEGGVFRRGPNGKDLIGLQWLAPEVKRHETLQVSMWWEQAKSQAKDGALPVLFYRQNRERWRVRMYGYAELCNGGRVRLPVDIAFDHFLLWFRNELPVRLDQQVKRQTVA